MTYAEATTRHQEEKQDMQSKLKDQMVTMVRMKQLEIELAAIKAKAD